MKQLKLLKVWKKEHLVFQKLCKNDKAVDRAVLWFLQQPNLDPTLGDPRFEVLDVPKAKDRP